MPHRQVALSAWMIVSSVYVKRERTLSRNAASRLYARKPEVVSGMSVPDPPPNDPGAPRLQGLLQRGKLLVLFHVSVADDDVRLTSED
jgi:hypothetical protein